MSEVDRHCIFTYPDGRRCKAYHVRRSQHCYRHAPERAADRLAAARRGAQMRNYRVALSVPPEGAVTRLEPRVFKPVNIRKVRDIRRGITQIQRAYQAGEITNEEAKIHLASLKLHLDAIKDLETAERLEVLEQAARARGITLEGRD